VYGFWEAVLLFLWHRNRGEVAALNSGELAHFSRLSYNIFRDKTQVYCSGTNFDGNRTAKGIEIEEQTCAFCTRNFGTNFKESLAQILRRKLGTGFEISLIFISEENDCCK
jgi:hypothetical protein